MPTGNAVIESNYNKCVSIDFVFSCFLVFGVVQAFVSNILKLDFPLVQLCVLLFCIYLFPGFVKFSWCQVLIVFLSIFSIACVSVSAAFIALDVYQEFFYQFFTCLLFLFFVLFFNKYNIGISVGRGVPWFRCFLVIYFALSLFVYLFFWEAVASLFYLRDNDFGGLLMDGRIRRMYGLLYNPLASAFSALLFLIGLHIFGVRDRLVHVLLFLIVVLAFSRSAILLLLLFCAYRFFYSRPKLFLVSFIPFLMAILGGLLSPIGGEILGRAFLDETGSIREHWNNYEIGLSHALSFHGEGFVDARGYGAWNVRLESMPLQFAFVGGGVTFFSFVVLLSLCFFMLFYRFGLWRALPLLLLIPLIFSFPLHTFNLPLLVFVFILCAWIPVVRYL